MNIGDLNLFPLYLSFKVAFIASIVCIVVGVPLSYLMSIKESKFTDFLDSLTNLPVVLPPTVLGYYILILLGRNSSIGKFLEGNFNIMLVFTPTGAVIAATIVALPFTIKTAKVAFSGINKDYINAARVLGRSEVNIFFTIVFPMAWPGIFAGISMSFVRALGDFGATLMVAGSIPNKTLTMPIAIYSALQSGDESMANFMVFIMTSIAVVVLFIVNRFENSLKKKGERDA